MGDREKGMIATAAQLLQLLSKSDYPKKADYYSFDARDKIDIRLLKDETVGRVPHERAPSAFDRREKNNPPESTGIPVALNSNAVAGIFPFRDYSLASATTHHAPLKNIVITSESALGRTREGSAFARNSAPPIWGRSAFTGAQTEGCGVCFAGSRAQGRFVLSLERP